MNMEKQASKKARLQSAMEYLMTYGWSILIIAIVIAALFALGVFSGSTLSNSCITLSGFVCSSPLYSHTTGNVVVTIGQVTKVTYITTNFIFLNSTNLAVFRANGVFPLNPGNYFVANMYSGGTTVMTLPISPPGTGLASGITGQIWVAYTTISGGPAYYAEVSTLTAKAV